MIEAIPVYLVKWTTQGEQCSLRVVHDNVAKLVAVLLFNNAVALSITKEDR